MFNEGKVKTPFVNLPPVSATASLKAPTTDSLKTSDSIEWATGSPAYIPTSPAYRNPDSPTYNPNSPVSPAYNPNATSTTDSSVYHPGPPYPAAAVSPAYNPNATSSTDSSVYHPGPPYPAPPPQSESILKVDEAVEKGKQEEEKKKDDSSENKTIVITKGSDDSSLSTNSDATKKISL